MSDLWIHHGDTNHDYVAKWKCKECRKIDKWYDKEIMKAGGIEKFLEKQKQKLDS